MKLAKALKVKNTLVKEISVLVQKLQGYNSYIQGTDMPYNSKNVLTIYEQKTQDLIDLKSKITAANQPIQSKIYRIAELKSQISHMQHISTSSGTSTSGYGERATEIVRIATISTLDLEAIIQAKVDEIDTLQEAIDSFNHTTDI